MAKMRIAGGWTNILMRDLVGRKVRTLRDMRNSLIIMPAGTECTVTSANTHISIEGPPCAHCNVRSLMRRISRLDVELLP